MSEIVYWYCGIKSNTILIDRIASLTSLLGRNHWNSLLKRNHHNFYDIIMMSDGYHDVSNWCVKLTIIASDTGLWPGRRLAIIRTNAEILLIGPLGTNSSEILIKILTFSFKKMHLNVSSEKWRPCCLGLNVLTVNYLINSYQIYHSTLIDEPVMLHVML